MRIVVFGSTGRTGRYVLSEAVERGYEVVAFTRSSSNFEGGSDLHSIIKGELIDPNAIDEAIQGTDAVISVLGPSNNNVEFEISSGMERIIASMKRNDVKRIVITAGAGVGDPDDQPTFLSKMMNWLVRTLSRNVYEDMVRTVELVRASGLDWTIVRAPMLTDQPKTGNVTVAWVGKGMGRQVTRGDLGAFVVDQVEDETYLRKAPALSN